MVWVKVGRKMGGYTSALKSKSLSPMASERTSVLYPMLGVV